MEPRRLFRVLVVLSLVLGFTGAIVDSLLGSNLPKEVISCAEESQLLSDRALLVLSVLLLGLQVIAVVGLLRFSSVGRHLYVLSVVLSVLSQPIFGILVLSSWAVPLGSLEAVLAGVVVAMSYMSPARLLSVASVRGQRGSPMKSEVKIDPSCSWEEP